MIEREEAEHIRHSLTLLNANPNISIDHGTAGAISTLTARMLPSTTSNENVPISLANVDSRRLRCIESLHSQSLNLSISLSPTLEN